VAFSSNENLSMGLIDVWMTSLRLFIFCKPN